MSSRALILAIFLPLTLAFSNTYPIVTWSSHRSSVLDLVPTSNTLFEKLSYTQDVCSHDAVFLVNLPGLHASDLRVLSPSSSLTVALDTAPSSHQFPYVRQPATDTFRNLSESLAARCGSRLISFILGQSGADLEAGSKHVLYASVPHLQENDFGHRANILVEYDSRLSDDLESIKSAFPNHLVVISGSAPRFGRRQLSSAPGSGTSFEYSNDLLAPNSTLPEGGILKRYQLLTPGLIISLAVAFFIILPVLFSGISTLASIQSPLRVEAPRGYNAQEKKAQ